MLPPNGSTGDLFADDAAVGHVEAIGPQACVLRGFALSRVDVLMAGVESLNELAPLRQMQTPSGLTMSVVMSNFGPLGWVTSRGGYRYADVDPLTGRLWPPMPAAWIDFACQAAAAAGFEGFRPDACLVNRYLPGSRLLLHQDRDELDYGAPIVSVSLGMPAVFLFGGLARSDRAARIPLVHGDVVVWGGVDRLRFHGVLPMKDQPHPLLGSQRFNLTFRKAGR